MSGLRSMAILTAALMASGLGPQELKPYISEPKEPKNKYGLTPEEIEQMKDMTPKEKKSFLKSRKD